MGKQSEHKVMKRMAIARLRGELGLSLRACARALRTSPGSVYYQCITYGIESSIDRRPPGWDRTNNRGRPGQRWEAAEVARLMALKAIGMRITDIADELGRRPSSCAHKIKEVERDKRRKEAAQYGGRSISPRMA